ncbi:pyridoxal-phosphate dependent enzyme [Ornithinimicrobium sp. INDO-MA30-4]|uniref:pyridoxal-phosphate dependent enzyme n=1 Tax=Ornithinimicrobium sp. INDO-MA30-4 TaxID=2908651 RepID=UPI0037CB13F2
MPDVVVVPVGGGGLLAGAATYLSQRHPEVRIVGVEPAGAASMRAALDAGGPVMLPRLTPSLMAPPCAEWAITPSRSLKLPVLKCSRSARAGFQSR